MSKLEDFTKTQLLQFVRGFNKKVKISGYSKMKKDELIKKIRDHPQLILKEGGDKVTVDVKPFTDDMKDEKKKEVKKTGVKKKLKIKVVNKK
tara:strand:- start:989 stop:1264 length:276 start_codon:yes stop_codon:yes gene_type:complete